MPHRTPHRVVAEELALLEQVSRALDSHVEPAVPTEAAVVRELERIRELLVSGREAKDRDLLEEEWRRNSAVLAQLRRASEARAPLDPTSPYFAHLRLREGAGERDLCLGRTTRIGPGLRIVDWRNAPISRLFYRYEQGEDYEEEIAGRPLAGTVVARRKLAIRDGRLDRVESPEGTFLRGTRARGGWRRQRGGAPQLEGGAGSALRVHGAGRGTHRRLGTDLAGERRRADKRLPEIAALIDPDQFELITHPASGLVVVRGSAGSGKTTVALHRIAYLAYDDGSIDSPDTLFVAFSPALRSYVERVLPALGVENARVLTYGEWAARQRARLFPALPTTPRYDTPEVVRRLKLHPAVGRALRARVRATPGEASAEQAMDDWASTLTHRELLERELARVDWAGLAPSELERAIDWCRDRNTELLTALDEDTDDETELDVEDDALLLRAWQLRVGPLRRPDGRPLHYRHVAIDEVQDLSPLEVQVLVDCLGPQRSATLAGDTQQHLLPHSGFESWTDLFDTLGLQGTQMHTLRIAYRSSREIAQFSRALLGDLAEDDEPRTLRTGPPVEVFRFTEHGACVAFLADALKQLARAEPLASVALLTESADTSELYASALAQSDVPRLRHVTDYDFSFAPGFEVTQIEQAKGLEFDYVVLIDASARSYPDTSIARRQLHVAASRAVHQLWVTSVGPPARAVEDAIS